MPILRLHLSVLPAEYVVARLPVNDALPPWLTQERRDSSDREVVAVLRSDQELSVITSSRNVPADVPCSRGWRCIRIVDSLDISVPGVLHSVIAPLADSGEPVMAIASYDTDHVLVQNLKTATCALLSAGHEVAFSPEP